MQKYIFLFLIICSMDLFPQEVGSGNNLEFTGNSSRVVYGNIYDALDLPLTIATWVYLPESSTSNRQVFFASCWPDNKVYSGIWTSIGHNAFGVSYGDGNGSLRPEYRRTKVADFSDDISGKWVHVAFVVLGPLDMKLYLNGVEMGGGYSGSGDAEMYNAFDGKAQIGFISNNNGNNFFHGELDELQFWNYDLSEEEIRTNMCKKLDGDEPSLIGYWNFDEGSGANTEELVSGNMGTIEGAANWQTSGAPIGDESYFKYFLPGKKKDLYENNAEDSFWISVESDVWEGYQVYKVNEEPNSTQGSSVNFDNGYYGIFPVFKNGVENTYKVDVLKGGCDNEVEFRNGNDDQVWEQTIQDSDSSTFYESTGITELNFEISNNLEPINNTYTICSNESIDIDVESGCALSYL